VGTVWDEGRQDSNSATVIKNKLLITEEVLVVHIFSEYYRPRSGREEGLGVRESGYRDSKTTGNRDRRKKEGDRLKRKSGPS